MIKRVLVANRGEIALRVFTTCRLRGVSTVAVFSDADASAPYVRFADAAVRLPGVSPADTYLRGDLIIAAALRAGADAVHPGYGFLSENSDFALAVRDAGLIWIGPEPSSIALMGSKISSKGLMASAGVPVLPRLDSSSVSAADLPVLIKASAGGGGRGMRIVSDISDLWGAVESASREAAAAFGDPAVFCERYLPNGRHLEVQILADTHGTVWALGERECSLQRRHQKVIEEAPSPLVTRLGPAFRERLLEAGRVAARTVGYVGAGTVEFLADERGHFWFLEMNTRLQVEHPVTEALFGLDLVSLQLDVADGLALGDEPSASGGYAVEARLYAENPADDWRPQAGDIVEFDIPGVETRFAAGTGLALPAVSEIDQRAGGSDGRRPASGARFGSVSRLRLDAGVEAGSSVSTHYDAMLAKVIAFGETREAAARHLADALRRSRLHGLTTNRDLLVATLLHPQFLAGDAGTGFYDTHPPSSLTAGLDPRLAAVVAAVSDSVHGRGPLLPGVRSGFRNIPAGFRRRVYRCGADEIAVEYRFTRHGVDVADGRGPAAAEAAAAEAETDGWTGPSVVVVEAGADEVVLDVDGVRRRFRVGRFDESVVVDSAAGSVTLVRAARFTDPGERLPSGALTAPMPGTVVRVGAKIGDTVTAGQPLVWLEAMKMEHTVRAPAAGTVTELPVTVGRQVTQGTPLAVVVADGA